MAGYTLWGRAGWGSAIVEAQLAWYGLSFTFEPVEDLFRTPDAAARTTAVRAWTASWAAATAAARPGCSATAAGT